MNRFWLFEWQQHDDEPPLHGFRGDFATEAEAKAEGERIVYDMVTVLDVGTGAIWENHRCEHHPVEWKSLGNVRDR
jgi:hypothetical protein